MTDEKARAKQFIERLDAANTQAKQLERRSATISARLDERKRQLKAAEERAVEAFGTSDLAKLVAMEASMRNENEEKLQNFESELRVVAEQLTNAEKLLSGDGVEPAGDAQRNRSVGTL